MVLHGRLTAALLLLAATACTKGSAEGPTAPPEPSPRAQTELDGVEATPEAGDVADADAEPLEQLDIDGVRLSLDPGGCDVVATFLEERREHHFDFPGDCHFAPDPQDRPAWVVPTDHGKAVLVVGSAPADGGGCDTALQVLVITEQGPALSSEIQRVSGCGPGPWDEMLYHVMASQRVELGSSG